MIPVPKLHLPLEPFVIWENGFSPEEIDKIIALGELREFKKGTVGGNSIGSQVSDMVIRNTDITWIESAEDTHWLYERLLQFVAQINHDKFQFDLHHIENLQYGKYKQDGHYTWHMDSGPNLPNHRKLSFVLGLSDPNSYEGGELQINVNGSCDAPHAMKIRKGDLIVFPSFMSHRVTPVTKGERMTLVTWAVGPKFK